MKGEKKKLPFPIICQKWRAEAQACRPSTINNCNCNVPSYMSFIPMSRLCFWFLFHFLFAFVSLKCTFADSNAHTHTHTIRVSASLTTLLFDLHIATAHSNALAPRKSATKPLLLLLLLLRVLRVPLSFFDEG